MKKRIEVTASQIHALDTARADLQRAELVLRMSQVDAQHARERAEREFARVLDECGVVVGADAPWVCVADGERVFLEADLPEVAPLPGEEADDAAA